MHVTCRILKVAATRQKSFMEEIAWLSHSIFFLLSLLELSWEFYVSLKNLPTSEEAFVFREIRYFYTSIYIENLNNITSFSSSQKSQPYWSKGSLQVSTLQLHSLNVTVLISVFNKDTIVVGNWVLGLSATAR